MESEKNISRDNLYDQLRKLAIFSYEFKDFERVQKILTIMVQNWPERVIARGKLASDVNVPDANLDTPVSIP